MTQRKQPLPPPAEMDARNARDVAAADRMAWFLIGFLALALIVRGF